MRRRLRAAGERLLAPLLGTVVAVETREPLVALTFDDGPDPEATPRLLELLARHGAHATFFALGRQLERHPHLAARIASEGHALANHTFDHPSLPRLGGRARRRDLRAAQRALGARSSGLVRPPYGHLDPASRLDMLRLGLQPVGWSAHCEDWRAHDAEALRARLEPALRPGAIVLMHDRLHAWDDPAARDRSPLLTALDAALNAAPAGTRFVTVPELLRAGRARRRIRWRRGDDAWLDGLERDEPSA